MTPWIRASVMLGVIAALCVGIDLRMARVGQWLPPIPRQIDGWSGQDLAMPAAILAYMDHPKYIQRTYTLPTGETAYANVIAINGIESFHAPTVCAAGSGYKQVDEQTVALAGPGTDARAMGFQNGPIRVVMIYWRQGRDGQIVSNPLPGWSDLTSVGAVHPNYNLLLGRSTCIARVYAAVPPSDRTGSLTCARVLDLSRALSEALRQDS
jgi:hypothetical protein